jgi:hypothetical protein
MFRGRSVLNSVCQEIFWRSDQHHFKLMLAKAVP